MKETSRNGMTLKEPMENRKGGLILFIRLFISIPTIGVGLAWVFSHTQQSLFFKAGLFLIVVGIVLIWQTGGKFTKPISSLAILLWAYPLGELVLYLKSPFNTIEGYNKECSVPDPIRGYRWTEKQIRYFKTSNGETVFDTQFSTNKQGWVMDQDYKEAKEAPEDMRWMLFGDSFSTGIMLENNLPNRLQEIMNLDSVRQSEVYSFAVHGGGIMNWYQTFFGEVIPNYEFDGVVLCVFDDNLYRDFKVQQAKPGYSFIGKIGDRDWLDGTTDFKHWTRADSIRLCYTDEQMDYMAKKPPRARFNWPLKNWLYNLINHKQERVDQNRKLVNDIDQLKRSLGDLKYGMLDQMLTWCVQHNKKLILTSVPSRDLLMERKMDEKNWHQKEMEVIAQHWPVSYLDGYNIFKGKGSDVLEKYWIKYDGHWNQNGSDLYADSLYKLIEEISANGRHP